MIRFVVEERIMPPWFADDESGPWRNDISLPERERRDMLRWIEAGCPEGDPVHAPLPRQWNAAGEWSIGEPDLVLRMQRGETDASSCDHCNKCVAEMERPSGTRCVHWPEGALPRVDSGGGESGGAIDG